MHRAWEDLALSEYCESVVQVCNVVLCYIFVRVKRLVTLRKISTFVLENVCTYREHHSRIILRNVESGC